MAVDFLNQLNEAQQAAVTNYEGPGLVIAGAGSGKTRVLTYRIAYLLHQGIQPDQILALTFTNKAAREMKERIGQLVGENLAAGLWMGTFHAIFARILRYDGSHLDYTSHFTIYDTSDSRNIIRSVIRELNLDAEIYKPAEVGNRISKAKNNLITPSAYHGSNELLEQDRRHRKPRLADIYTRYAQICKKSDAMDFDDLLLNTFILFRDAPEILKKYQHLFSFVLVDEYQDTNFVQYSIVSQLSHLHKNICVVGDDAQSIYSFRGARIENILNFKHDYPEYSLYKLEQNYRSTKNIVGAANGVIKKNQDQISKEVWSDNESGEKIRLLRSKTDNDEGFSVASLIQDSRYREHLKYSDFAILYRTNAQSRIFEEAFRKLNIPYVVYGSLSFYQRKEIKDLLAYYRLTVNPLDEEALFRIINYPARGIGDTTLNRIRDISRSSGKRPWEILNGMAEFSEQFNKGIMKRLAVFTGMIKGFIAQQDSLEAFDLAFTIAEQTGILGDLHYDKSPENISKYENLQELLNSIKEYTENQEESESATLSSYLQNIALLTDADKDKNGNKDRVTVMTIHSAKGLEFKQVFVTGLEEELFPARLSATTREDLEEERRLFYVSITRAMQKLTLSFAETRYKWGVRINCIPSRFLNDIDAQYYEELPVAASPFHSSEPGSFRKSDNNQYRRRGRAVQNRENSKPAPGIQARKPAGNFKKFDVRTPEPQAEEKIIPDLPDSIQAGMEVRHVRFGKGKVLKTEGELSSRKATVFFQKVGQKQLLLRFAKLQILSGNNNKTDE